MLRIVGLQRGETADHEFLLLQNQGSMRINLKGHAILSESALLTGDLGRGAYAFPDDVFVAPGLYVVLTSGAGNPRWARSKDGASVYHAYMFSDYPVWSHVELPLHTMGTQHVYSERAEPIRVR
jgi:hypothetical protein